MEVLAISQPHYPVNVIFVSDNKRVWFTDAAMDFEEPGLPRIPDRRESPWLVLTVWIVNANRRNLVELTQRSLKQLVIIRGDDEPEIDFGQCANKS